MSTVKNQPFSITLPVQYGTGYSWKLAAISEFKVLKTNFSQSTDKQDGKIEQQVFNILPLKKGKFSICFKLGRNWESQTVETKCFQVTVQ